MLPRKPYWLILFVQPEKSELQIRLQGQAMEPLNPPFVMEQEEVAAAVALKIFLEDRMCIGVETINARKFDVAGAHKLAGEGPVRDVLAFWRLYPAAAEHLAHDGRVVVLHAELMSRSEQ